MFSQNNNEMADCIRAILPAGAALLSCECDDACFGNMVVRIQYKSRLHTFITDRGEIIHNNTTICDSTNYAAGETDVFPKLLEMIRQELR